MAVVMELSIWPMDKGESVGGYVARSLDVIDGSGLDYRMGPMGTCIEGSYDDVMAVAKQCCERMAEDCNRITATIKLDYRKDQSGRLTGKLTSVEQKLGRSLRT